MTRQFGSQTLIEWLLDDRRGTRHGGEALMLDSVKRLAARTEGATPGLFDANSSPKVPYSIANW